MKGLILSGGHGTGLRPLTHTGPKQLIPIANKPNILYCLEDLRNAGITDIGIILGTNMPEKVRALLGNGSNFGVKITYIVQGEPKGIAHAIGCAEEFMGEELFVVYLGDNILKGGIQYLVEDFEKERADCVLGLCKVKEPQKYGVAELDTEGHIVRAIEKPKEPKSDLAIIGVYIFNSSVFPVIKTLKPSWRNELEITEAINSLIASGKKVNGRIVVGWWKDTGRPEDIIDANHLVLDDLAPFNKGILEKNVVIKGRVGIDSNTIIKEGTVVRGPTIIGKNCCIGPNVYIGPYTSIGDNCTITKGEIESSIIMGNTKIDIDKKLVDSLIGKHVTITSSNEKLPKGIRLILGENSIISI